MKKQRWLVYVVSLVLALLALAAYLVLRPQTIATYDSPDGQWELAISDVDPSPFQVTAEFSLYRHGAWRPLPGKPCRVNTDSCVPTLAPPTWSDHGVQIGGLRGDFSTGEQTWHDAAGQPVP